MERGWQAAARARSTAEFACGFAARGNARARGPPGEHPGNFILGRTVQGNFSRARSPSQSQAGRGAGRRGRELRGKGGWAGWVPLLSGPGMRGAGPGEATHQLEREEDGEQGDTGAHDDEQQEDDERVLLAHAVVGLIQPVPGPLQPVAVAAAARGRRRHRLGAVPQVAAAPHRLLPHRGGSRGAGRASPARAAPPARPPPPAAHSCAALAAPPPAPRAARRSLGAGGARRPGLGAGVRARAGWRPRGQLPTPPLPPQRGRERVRPGALGPPLLTPRGAAWPPRTAPRRPGSV